MEFIWMFTCISQVVIKVGIHGGHNYSVVQCRNYMLAMLTVYQEDLKICMPMHYGYSRLET